NQGGEKIPELNVGLYVLNLTAPGRRALEVGAVGHAAEGYVGFLGSVPTSSGTYIRFGCKAADDTLKVRSVANSN
nr:hypothetical protein [Bdellovibrionales bacterium]